MTTAVFGSIQRGGGPLAQFGCECPCEQLAPDEWRTYHADDCPYILNKIRTCDPKTRDLANRVLKGLTIMRDSDDDGDEWLLPDLAVISRAMSALGSLVKHAEDRHRFKIALERIGKEWTDAGGSSDDIRKFARSVVAGGSARVSLRAVNTQSQPEE